MKISSNLVRFLLSATALVVTAAGVAGADAPQLDPETKARVERFEKGPATINVSKYPDGIKENYEVFATKCTQCHRLSRPINSDYALPDEWSRYIKRMMHKPGSGISNGEGKQIYEFLVYDASVRKKALVDEKLAKATADEKKDAETKFQAIHAKYDK